MPINFHAPRDGRKRAPARGSLLPREAEPPVGDREIAAPATPHRRRGRWGRRAEPRPPQPSPARELCPSLRAARRREHGPGAGRPTNVRRVALPIVHAAAVTAGCGAEPDEGTPGRTSGGRRPDHLRPGRRARPHPRGRAPAGRAPSAGDERDRPRGPLHGRARFEGRGRRRGAGGHLGACVHDRTRRVDRDLLRGERRLGEPRSVRARRHGDLGLDGDRRLRDSRVRPRGPAEKGDRRRERAPRARASETRLPRGPGARVLGRARGLPGAEGGDLPRRRDGRTIGTMSFYPDGQGGWLEGSATACSDLGATGSSEVDG